MHRTFSKLLLALLCLPLALGTSASVFAADAAIPPLTKKAPRAARSAHVPVQGPEQEIVMFVGQIKTIPADKVQRVAIGNGSLVSTKFIDPSQMLLIAEGVGDTSLILWAPNGDTTRYLIRVGAKDSEFAYRAAREVLADIPSVHVIPMGSSIALTGSASPSQMERINALSNRYPQFLSLVKPLDVEFKKMIYMKVQILEVKKSLSQQLGVQWGSSLAGPQVGFVGNVGSTNSVGASSLGATTPAYSAPVGISGLRTYLGIASTLQSTINIAKNNGDITVLAEPELAARSGGTANFLVGGQIPISTSGAFGTTNVSFKDYGIKLTIKPATDDNGNVIASVKTEMSQIDSSVSINGTPGFLTRTTDTEFNVKSGQTMVLSGLVDREMQKDISRIPGIGDLPIIGRLFRSDSFTSGRTDMVILVTPMVIDATSSVNQERLEKGMEMKEHFERNLSKQDIVD